MNLEMKIGIKNATKKLVYYLFKPVIKKTYY